MTELRQNERVAIARLHAMLEILPTALDKRLRPAGISGFEYTLLETLAEAKDHRLRLSDLAAKTNATLPRLSRVANSLERRGLAVRTPCAEDARATNLELTPLGSETHAHSRELYATAVRELVLDGLRLLPGDGTAQLSDMSYAILSSLDRDRTSEVTYAKGTDLEGSCAADPVAAGA